LRGPWCGEDQGWVADPHHPSHLGTCAPTSELHLRLCVCLCGFAPIDATLLLPKQPLGQGLTTRISPIRNLHHLRGLTIVECLGAYLR